MYDLEILKSLVRRWVMRCSTSENYWDFTPLLHFFSAQRSLAESAFGSESPSRLAWHSTAARASATSLRLNASMPCETAITR